MVLNRYLLDRLCSCLFLCGSDHALEEAFLFLRSGFGLAVQSLDIQYIDTADNGLYFLFTGTFSKIFSSQIRDTICGPTFALMMGSLEPRIIFGV